MKKSVFFLISIMFFMKANSQSWLLTGNSGTNNKINFIGTTDNTQLMFRINNNFAGMLDTINHWTSFGYGAGKTMSGIENTAVGYKVLNLNTSGMKNTGVGNLALSSNTTGYYNSAIGSQALTSNTTGSLNIAIGTYALNSSTTATQNTAVGVQSMYYCTTGGENTGLGYGALNAVSTGYGNSAMGAHSVDLLTSGTFNTGSGYQAMQGAGAGSWNTAMGAMALKSIGYNGNYNTSVGGAALYYCGDSYYNTAIGYYAGGSYALGYNNVFLGANTRTNGAGYYNCIAIGQDVTCTNVNQARIGNAATYSIGGYVGWSNISDGRYKKDIKENVKGLDFIMQLRPVTYHLDITGLRKKLGEGKDEKGKEREMDPSTRQSISDKEKQVYTGFIAQEVEQAAQKIGYDFSGVDKPKNENDLYGLRYAEFVVPLVKSVQELQGQVNDLKKQVEALIEMNKQLQQQVKPAITMN